MEHAHPYGIGHFLLAGTGRDARFLSRLLEALPADAYGQLFLESAERSRLRMPAMPSALAPSWLSSDLDPRPGRSPEPGVRLAVALRAWAAEWLPDPGYSGDLPFTIWIGGAGNLHVDRVCRDLLSGYPGLHMHRPESAHAWEA